MRIRALTFGLSAFGLLGLVAATPAAAADRIEATYNFILKGFVVSTAETVAEIGPQDYQLDINFRMRGLARIFVSGHSDITATGKFADGGRLTAEHYVSAGHWDGSDYRRTLTFDDTGKLLEQTQEFPEKWLKEYRYEPVPEALQVGPDPASLLIAFLRDPMPADAATKSIKVFDGDSVMEWQLSCAPGMVELEESRHSPKFGPARECKMGNHLVAGKLIETEKQRKKRLKREAKAAKRKEKGKDEDAKDETPRLWLQPVSGSSYLVPVRAEFKTGMGTVRMYLKDISYAETSTLAR